MPKGKPWTVEQERKLQELVKARLSPERIAAELGQSVDSIRQEMRRLGLEVVGFEKFSRPTTSYVLPKELLTVEQVMLSLAAAMKALEQPGLDKAEILRLRSLVQASKIYQEKFAEYADYLRIEEELMELRKEVAGLRKSAEKHAEKRP
jgi:IS30 family transposase